jgi:hypothetical protein
MAPAPTLGEDASRWSGLGRKGAIAGWHPLPHWGKTPPAGQGSDGR